MAKRSGHRQQRHRTLDRQSSVRLPRRTFLVFCEGARTEPDYLKALKRELAEQEVVSVEIQLDTGTHGSAPLTLVKAAAGFRTRFPAGQSEVDEVWCIFDVEQPVNHPNLNKAIGLAKTSGSKSRYRIPASSCGYCCTCKISSLRSTPGLLSERSGSKKV